MLEMRPELKSMASPKVIDGGREKRGMTETETKRLRFAFMCSRPIVGHAGGVPTHSMCRQIALVAPFPSLAEDRSRLFQVKTTIHGSTELPQLVKVYVVGYSNRDDILLCYVVDLATFYQALPDRLTCVSY